MREYVEIGIGREARRAYRLEDINVVPARRTRSSKDVNTTWHIDAYTFDIPFLSHPTDSLASPGFVIEMNKQGGLGILNAEGLIGRCTDLDSAIRSILTSSNPTETLQKLHSEPLNLELLADRIAQVRASDTTVAVRVSPQNCRELAPAIIKAGADILVVQGTLISAEHVEAGEPFNLKEFVGSVEIPIIAGGVADYTTAMHLMRAGVVGVIVGGGTHTGSITQGIDTSMATAIADVAAARREYLDETGGRYVHIIADGEIHTSGFAVRAIACGADAVMIGEPLAAAAEALAPGYYWPSVAAHPRFPRGDVQAILAQPEKETVSLAQILHGPSTSPYGDQNWVGGLKRALAKCGYTDLKSFQKVALHVSL